MDFNTHLQMLEMLSWALDDQATVPGFTANDINGRMLLYDAVNHSVLPLIVDGMIKHKDVFDTEQIIGKSAMSQYKDKIIIQAQKTADFLLLYEYLASKDLHPLVVKGIICRNLYPEPEHRPSLDEDLLIDPAEFPQYHQALLERGFTCVNQPDEIDTHFEIAYENKENHLYIEVHKSLFPPESSAYGNLNKIFEHVRERSIIQDINGTQFCTLCPTDHLLYIILHAYKHFLHSGFGIRQVADIVLYSERYRDCIDWAEVSSQLEKVHVKEFMAAVYRIADKYLLKNNHIQEYMQDLNYKEIDELPLLKDIMDGGIYGASSRSRLHSSNITLNAVSTGKRQNGVLKSVFLPLKNMEGKYPYLKKAKFLLPISWIQRIFAYLRETKRDNDENVLETVRIGSERVRLLEQYHIITDKE